MRQLAIMMGSRIACVAALILACASAEPNVTALLDLVEVAAITKNATRLAAFEDALADVKAQRDVADDDEYIALLRSAASGNATALFHLAKFFCAPLGGAPPAPPRCERLLRVAVDAIDDPEIPQSELSNFALRARGKLFDAYADGAPGEVEFYLATHYDRFTPWWAEERAAGAGRCLAANEAAARHWYTKAAFRGHGAAAFHLFFIFETRANQTEESRALATYWLDVAVKFADPTAVSTKAARRKLTVRDFLERHRHLYDAQYDDVVARVAAFLEEHAGVGLDDDPGDPAAKKTAESADAPAEVESATAPPPEEDAAEAAADAATDAATTPPEEDAAAAAPPPERKGPLAGVRRRLGSAFRRRGKPPASEL